MIIENNKNRKYSLLWMATDDPDDEDKQGEDKGFRQAKDGEGGRSGEKRITSKVFTRNGSNRFDCVSRRRFLLHEREMVKVG